MLDIYALIGRRIKQERSARHLTQQELADAAGMDTAHLSRIEHGKAVPSINMVGKIADALGLPVGVLFADVPARRVQNSGWADKMAALIKDMSPKRRAKVLRVLKSIAEND